MQSDTIIDRYIEESPRLLKFLKNPIVDFFWKWYNIPAYIIHELSHYSVLLICYIPFVQCVDWRRSRPIFERRGLIIDITCNIWMSCKYPLVLLILAGAPVLAWLSGLVYAIVSHNWWMLAYFSYGYQMCFNLSSNDKNTIRRNWSILTKRKVNEVSIQEIPKKVKFVKKRSWKSPQRQNK